MPADDPAAALIYVPPPARSPLPWSRDFSFRVGSRDAFNGQHATRPSGLCSRPNMPRSTWPASWSGFAPPAAILTDGGGGPFPDTRQDRISAPSPSRGATCNMPTGTVRPSSVLNCTPFNGPALPVVKAVFLSITCRNRQIRHVGPPAPAMQWPTVSGHH